MSLCRKGSITARAETDSHYIDIDTFFIAAVKYLLVPGIKEPINYTLTGNDGFTADNACSIEVTSGLNKTPKMQQFREIYESIQAEHGPIQRIYCQVPDESNGQQMVVTLQFVSSKDHDKALLALKGKYIGKDERVVEVSSRM